MTLNKLKVCVIDDEKPIRQVLVKTLNKSPKFEVVGEAESVYQGVQVIEEEKPDAVFLDIKLREGDAFQLINIMKRRMPSIPPIIINTGYREFDFAQKIFNQYKDCVISILEKPFWEDWDEKEKKIIDLIYAHQSLEKLTASNKIVIKSDYKSFIFEPKEIMFFEVNPSAGPGKINMGTIDKEMLINKSLSDLQKILPAQFIRVSRFLIINFDHIDYYDHSDHVLFLKGLKRDFGVGNTYEQNIFNALG